MKTTAENTGMVLALKAEMQEAFDRIAKGTGIGFLWALSLPS